MICSILVGWIAGQLSSKVGSCLALHWSTQDAQETLFSKQAPRFNAGPRHVHSICVLAVTGVEQLALTWSKEQ